MEESNPILNINRIKSRIHTIRGQQVMLDSDLAELYGVLTKNINKAVKRNIERFPKDFMFQLTKEEYGNLKFRFGTSSDSLRFQNGTLEKGRGRHRKYLPYAFTEQGVANLSSVLTSGRAIKVNIQIMRAFVAMRRFISKNADIFFRIDDVERNQIHYQIETDNRFRKVFDAIESKGIKPSKGIFFEGQIFDAYRFVSGLIRSAEKSIVLIDNYVDERVLTLFCKRRAGVSAEIFTKNISKQLKQDLEKYNSQYPCINLKRFRHSHDRFMIIDNKEVYHLGASLKDLGRKWFAFSKFDKDAILILERLKI